MTGMQFPYVTWKTIFSAAWFKIKETIGLNPPAEYYWLDGKLHVTSQTLQSLNATNIFPGTISASQLRCMEILDTSGTLVIGKLNADPSEER